MIEEPEYLFPFDFMEVGDSFFLPTLRIPKMTYIVDTRAKAAGIRVKVYPMIDKEVMGVRVWRVA